MNCSLDHLIEDSIGELLPYRPESTNLDPPHIVILGMKEKRNEGRAELRTVCAAAEWTVMESV